jgi:hypothetical protein
MHRRMIVCALACVLALPGLALELTAKGTKYYKDDDLN